jgi:hypothetical protein
MMRALFFGAGWGVEPIDILSFGRAPGGVECDFRLFWLGVPGHLPPPCLALCHWGPLLDDFASLSFGGAALRRPSGTGFGGPIPLAGVRSLGGCCRSCPIHHFGGGWEDPTVFSMGRFLLRERAARLPASIAGCVQFPYGSVGGNQHQLHNRRCGHHLWRPRRELRGGCGGSHRVRPRGLEPHIRRPASAGSGAATSVAVPDSLSWFFGQRVLERRVGRSTIRQQLFVRSLRVGHPLQRVCSTLGTTRATALCFQGSSMCLERKRQEGNGTER